MPPVSDTPGEHQLSTACERSPEEQLCLSADTHLPAQWYMHRATAATDEQQHLTQYRVLSQTRHHGPGIFVEPNTPIYFLDEDGNPTLLHDMLRDDFKRVGWDQPWTSSDNEAVGQKISLRVRLPECSIDKQENVWRFTQKREAITKAQLGRRIAKTLKEKLKGYCQSNSLDFEDLVIYELQNVSQGSWQPVLGTRVPVA